MKQKKRTPKEHSWSTGEESISSRFAKFIFVLSERVGDISPSVTPGSRRPALDKVQPLSLNGRVSLASYSCRLGVLSHMPPSILPPSKFLFFFFLFSSPSTQSIVILTKPVLPGTEDKSLENCSLRFSHHHTSAATKHRQQPLIRENFFFFQCTAIVDKEEKNKIEMNQAPQM